MKQNLILVGIVAIVVAAIVGGYFYPKFATIGGSATGTTFNTAKFSGTAISLASPGSNGTSTSILNTDAFDRYVTAVKIGCEGVGTSQTAYTGTGLASLTITIATSSTVSPVTNGNTNTLPVATIATSTAQFALASSTAGTPGNGNVSNIWKTGSYLTFFANATNTAACTVGVDYIGS